MLEGFFIHQLQADEIRTFVRAKKRVVWVLTTLEVWSRLWVSLVVGRRNSRKIKGVILNTLLRGRIAHHFLFTTDGFQMYEWAKKLLAGACMYGQVIRNAGRIESFEDSFSAHRQSWTRRFFTPRIPAPSTPALWSHNLTIRQGCAYLGRRTPCHARRTESLVGKMALLATYYNFVRPYMALKFGKTVRTPAMQAGLTKESLSFRVIYTYRPVFLLLFLVVVGVRFCRFRFQIISFRL